MPDRELVIANILTKKRLSNRANIGDSDAIKTADSVEARFEQRAIRMRKRKERIQTRKIIFV